LGQPSHPGGIPVPRRELLTPTERVQLFAFPEDEGELIQLATLARADLTYIRQHRGDHNRLGLAVQMVYLRHPSRVLPPNEAPSAAARDRRRAIEGDAGGLVAVCEA
jgi:hypothetical protein